MADISKIQLPSGTSYDIKDAVARQMDLIVTYTETSTGSGVGDLALSFAVAEDGDDESF